MGGVFSPILASVGSSREHINCAGAVDRTVSPRVEVDVAFPRSNSMEGTRRTLQMCTCLQCATSQRLQNQDIPRRPVERTIGKYYVSPNDVRGIYYERRRGRLNYIRL